VDGLDLQTARGLQSAGEQATRPRQVFLVQIGSLARLERGQLGP